MSCENSAAPLSFCYVNDSGSPRTHVVWAALSVERAYTARAAELWAGFRAGLAADPRLMIPADAPLRAERLAAARGRHLHRSRSSDPFAHRRRTQDVILRGLRTVAAMPGVRIDAVHRKTGDYAVDRPDLYAALLHRLNAEIVAEDGFGFVMVEGDGREKVLSPAHRALPAGLGVLGLPVFRDVPHPGLLEAVDMVAYAAYQAVAEHPDRAFMHHWFEDELPGARGPDAL